MSLINKPTFKQKTVTTVDMTLDGDDLEFAVEVGADYNDIEFTSGEIKLVIRREDLIQLSLTFPRRPGDPETSRSPKAKPPRRDCHCHVPCASPWGCEAAR